MAFWRKPVIYILIGILYFLLGAKTIDGRGGIAGKAGAGGGLRSSGRSHSDINDELIMVSIGMAIMIGILITLALCYIAREECKKHREYYVTV